MSKQQRSYLGLRGGGLNLAQLFLVVAPAFVLFGYNQACPGGLLSLEDWTHTFPQIATTGPNGSPGKSTLQGFVVAIFALGALFGALSCSWSADRLGRRKTIFLGAVLTLVGEILQCAAFSLAQFVVGRVVLGAGIGMLSAVVPVWQSECSPAKHRGKHVILDGTFISAGFAITSWVNLGFFQIKTGSVPWRLPLAIPIAFSIVAMAAIFFLPESPRWLVRVNRVEEARRTLSALRDTDVDSSDVKREIDGIELSLEETSNNAASMRDIFTMGEDKLFFRFMLCIVLQFFQQMSGGNLISVYSTVIFQENLQLSSQVARILSGGALTWKLLCCAVAFFTVDRFGRRILIMVSGTGMALCMLCLAVATSFPHDNKSASIASVFFIFLFNFFIVLGFLGANWLYATEVAPIRLRIAMASISTANNWLW